MQATDPKISKQFQFYCELCKIELPVDSSIKEHLLGKGHKNLDTPELMRKRVEEGCGLYVLGISNLSHDIVLKYFNRYGKIVWVHFDDEFVLIDYTESTAVQKAIKSPHFLGGKMLHLRCRKLKIQPQELSIYSIKQLECIPKLVDQVLMLKTILQSSEQTAKYNKICEDLSKIVQPAFTVCSIHSFGSSVTGLDFFDSDLDIHISGIKSTQTDETYLTYIDALLLQSEQFTKINLISARVPILKCVHLETGVSCDINVKNMLGVFNSELIKYYISIDPKVHCLMMILKYWAKVHEIIGDTYLLTSYALYIMIIFFLQQIPYNFPSVVALKENIPFTPMQDGWNCGFQLIDVKDTSIRNISLLKLLESFFTFYAEFDFGNHIICPYLGRIVEKGYFAVPEVLPSYYNNYKNYLTSNINPKPLKVDSWICVQDPFEHNINIASICTSSKLKEFVNLCKLGKKLCESGEDLLLYKLFTEKPEGNNAEYIVKYYLHRSM